MSLATLDQPIKIDAFSLGVALYPINMTFDVKNVFEKLYKRNRSDHL